MGKKSITIIIITYNIDSLITNCIDPIINTDNAEILVIDNHSTDHTFALLKEKYRNRLKIFRNKTNIGFAKAVNQGIKKSNNEYILLLNPDTIPTKKAITILLDFVKKDTKIGFVGGRMVKPSGNIHGTYVNKPNFFTALFEFTNLKKVFINNKYSEGFYYKKMNISQPFPVYGLSGGFLLFRRSLISKIGYFDEHFFMYLEDIDIGIRAREAGFLNYYIPKSTIIHDSGSSSKKASIYNINVSAWRDSRNYFFKKYMSNQFLSTILKIAFFIDDIVVDSFHLLKNKPLT